MCRICMQCVRMRCALCVLACVSLSISVLLCRSVFWRVCFMSQCMLMCVLNGLVECVCFMFCTCIHVGTLKTEHGHTSLYSKKNFLKKRLPKITYIHTYLHTYIHYRDAGNQGEGCRLTQELSRVSERMRGRDVEDLCESSLMHAYVPVTYTRAML
jgi:hypothetical protein